MKLLCLILKKEKENCKNYVHAITMVEIEFQLPCWKELAAQNALIYFLYYYIIFYYIIYSFFLINFHNINNTLFVK